MKHLIYEEAEQYKVALLLKTTVLNKQAIKDHYIDELVTLGVSTKDCVVFTLDSGGSTKVKASTAKDYLVKLLKALDQLKISHLYVTDGTYFKALTKLSKAEPHLGYVLPCKCVGYEHMSVVLGVNYQALLYNPVLQDKLSQSLVALSASLLGNYVAPGSKVIHSEYYPTTLADISTALANLMQYEALTVDIEAFSLSFNEAGLGSIAFSWDSHNGIAFLCDYSECNEEKSMFGRALTNRSVREIVKKFLTEYRGEITWHNATYDIKVLVYTLWMKHPLDTEGLLEGLEVMTRRFHDTKIIAYLATNSTAGNVLGLKALAQEFAGNWAQDNIKDIRRIESSQLLRYNLVDALCTCYVRDKYFPVMVADRQLDIYENLMLPSLKTIIQMELTGMPMEQKAIHKARAELEAKEQGYLSVINNSPVVKTLNLLLRRSAMEDANAKLKVKQHPLEKFDGVVFNPNSGKQLQRLLYECMGLPVLDFTDTKMPATGADTVEKLSHHTKDPDYVALLEALIGYGGVNKILSTFIPAFERGLDKADGKKYLHGSFNLGGTVSGRLSSSDPSLQNLPSGSEFGKLVKQCFSAPEGWLMVGADFSSLEDMISALTTKDKNKLKVYTDGYCGHCLRAYSYFKDELPEVRQATANERCFSIEVNGQLLLCKSGDFVKLDSGETISIEDYFDTYS